MGLSSLTCHRRLGKCRRVEVVSRCLPPRATEFLYSHLTEFSGNGVFHFQSRLRDLNLNSPVRVIASLISYWTDSELTRPSPLRSIKRDNHSYLEGGMSKSNSRLHFCSCEVEYNTFF